MVRYYKNYFGTDERRDAVEFFKKIKGDNYLVFFYHDTDLFCPVVTDSEDVVKLLCEKRFLPRIDYEIDSDEVDCFFIKKDETIEEWFPEDDES